MLAYSHGFRDCFRETGCFSQRSYLPGLPSARQLFTPCFPQCLVNPTQENSLGKNIEIDLTIKSQIATDFVNRFSIRVRQITNRVR